MTLESIESESTPTTPEAEQVVQQRLVLGSRWINADGEEIEITAEADTMGRVGYRLTARNAGGHMGRNHWRRLIPSENSQLSDPSAGSDQR